MQKLVESITIKEVECSDQGLKISPSGQVRYQLSVAQDHSAMAMAQAFTPALLAHPRSALAPSASITCASARSSQRYPTRPLSLWNSPTSTLKIKSIPTIRGGACGGCQASMGLEALVFDCDGVILESEDLHRRAYNAAFEEFQVRSPSSAPEPLVWTPEFYDELQNTIGGGKPKMRWLGFYRDPSFLAGIRPHWIDHVPAFHCRYFSRHGWPSSTILPNPPTTEEEEVKLIDTIQVHSKRNVSNNIIVCVDAVSMSLFH